MDVVIAPGPGVPDGLVIGATHLVERFSHSSGPGGQSVNTTDSRVEVELDIEACPTFTPVQRRRLLTNLASRLVNSRLVVTASEERSQYRNRVAARERMADILRAALAPPLPPRRATRPTRGSRERRLAAKRRRSRLKADRARPSRDD